MKQKKYLGLSNAERSEIEILVGRSCGVREIAMVLGRSPNTISREISGNSVRGEYVALKAKQKSRLKRRSRRFQWMKIEQHPALKSFIIEKLALHWSPDAIAGYLKYQQSTVPTVGKDQLYAWLYSAWGQAYCQHLLSRRYQPKPHREIGADRLMIPDRIGIEQRPAVVDRRQRPGDWEGDTVVSGKRAPAKAAVAVLSERMTKLIVARLLPNLRPESFTSATVTMLEGKQADSLSLDNGIENKRHAGITKAVGTKVFFCDPYSSWQKGGVENANKMLRRYLPKGCDLSQFSQTQINGFVALINNKPRRCLGYKSALQYALEKRVILS